MFMLPLFVLLRRIAEPISFLSPLFPPMWKRKRWIFRASASTVKRTISTASSFRILGTFPPILIYKVAILSQSGSFYCKLIYKNFFMLHFLKKISRYALVLHICFATADKCYRLFPLKHFLAAALE